MFDTMLRLILLLEWGLALLGDWPRHFVLAACAGLLVWLPTSITYRRTLRCCTPAFTDALRASRGDSLIELALLLLALQSALWVHMWLDGWPGW